MSEHISPCPICGETSLSILQEPGRTGSYVGCFACHAEGRALVDRVSKTEIALSERGRFVLKHGQKTD